MARNTYQDDPNFLFEVRFTLYCKEAGPSRVIIRAWENGRSGPNHTRLDCELLWNGEVIFPRKPIEGEASLCCGVPGHHTVDGDTAKELATSLFCLKPGDTDADFFSEYSAEQIAWVEEHAETLSMLREDRWGSP